MPTVEFLDAGKKVSCGQYANLRKVALVNGVEVYKPVHKLPPPLGNCRGNGMCGFCVMEIVEGLENLSPRTLREQFKLKGQPENHRLSCQCQVMGDIVCTTARALDDSPVVSSLQPRSQ